MCLVLLVVAAVFGNVLLSEAVVEEYLEPSMNPCDDFYQYACGKWSDVNSGVKNGDVLSLLGMTMNKKVAGLLESEHDEGVLEKLKTFYKSCKELKAYNMSVFLDTVKPKSGWALSNSWKKNDFHWLETIAELRKYGAIIFLEQTVMPKWDNASVNFIYLDIVKPHPIKPEHLEAVLKKASLDVSIAEGLLSFESQLFERLGNISTADDSVEVVLGHLGESLPEIDWSKYLSIVFDKQFDLFTPMIVQNMESMLNLVNFLEKSQPSMVCNYIMVKFLLFLDKYSIEEVSSGHCVAALHQGMPLAVDNIIENHFYDHEYDQDVQDLFNQLKVEFLSGVSRLYENDRDVLLFLYSKVSVMDIQIGNSKRNLTSAAVAKYYQGLDITDKDFYGNLLAAFKYKVSKDSKSLDGTPVDVGFQWTVSPSPFYLHSKNRVVVPLTLLQEKIFGKESTDKYSALGFIIGHEFLHGFDINGVNYDHTGCMVGGALSQHMGFLERVQCILTEIGTNGVGEKIADLGGIRLAFNALQRSLMQIGKTIDSKREANRSLGKTFFIDYAQFFCGTDNEKTAKGSDDPDIHDKDSLRVKNSVMNFKEFTKVFNCPNGSKMNPEKKCRVW